MSKNNRNNKYQQPKPAAQPAATVVKPVSEAPVTPEPMTPKIELVKPAKVTDRALSYGTIFKQRMEEARQRKAKFDAARKAKGKP